MNILEENKILVLYIPITNKAFVFRVRSVINRAIKIDYGPLPIPANYPFASYIAGTPIAPADGVIPAYAYTPIGAELTFPLSGAYDETDMWYMPKDYNDRVFHVITKLTPAWLRCEITIPKSVMQGRFQKEKVTTGIEKLFGYTRGSIETAHIPGLHYGYRFGNDSNLYVYTGVGFDYGEYVVETPRDSGLIFDILTRRIKADKWISLPISVYDAAIRKALTDAYGIEGFTVYGIHQRSQAIPEYEALLKEVLI